MKLFKKLIVSALFLMVFLIGVPKAVTEVYAAETITIKENPETVYVQPKTTVTWNVVATGDGLSYQWQYKAPEDSTWSNFSRETSTTLTKTVPATWNNWAVRCLITDKNKTTVRSAAANIRIVTAISITEQPEDAIIQAGTNVTWKVAATGTGLTYKWQYKSAVPGNVWSTFSGATAATMTKKVPADWDGWSVRCVITDANGNTIYSNISKIKIGTGIVITEQPDHVVTAPDVSVMWAVSATGDGLKYQWQYKDGNNWSNFSGATAATMTKKVPASWNGWAIRCMITDANNNLMYTSVSTITINTAIIITEQPESITIGPATSSTWSVKATGEGLKYQWQYKNGNNWSNFSGATAATMTRTIPAEWDGWSVRCLITDAYGNSIYSKIVKIDINTEIVITEQPESVLAEPGSSVTWEVGATGTNLKYQWQYKTGNNWNSFAGGTSAVMTKVVQPEWNEWPIRCKISDSKGNIIYTRTVILKIGTAIVIQEQPEDVIAEAGSNVTWTVKATGDNLRYQWQYKDGKNWSKFSGATTPTLTKKVPAEWDGWQIRCMLTDASDNVSYTNIATLYIGTPIVISKQPKDVIVEAGKTATWSIEANGDNLSYQWQYLSGKNWSNFSGERGTTMTKTVPEAWDGWKVRCVLTDAAGHVINSKTATITIGIPPVEELTLTKDVVKDTTVDQNEKVTLSVAASVSTATYQWYKGTAKAAIAAGQENDLTKYNWTAVSSARSANYAVNTAAAGTQYYYCAVTAGDQRVNSSVAKVTVVAPATPVEISITSQPVKSITANEGQTYTVKVVASIIGGNGTETLTYQWQKKASNGNWENIPSATAASYSFVAADATVNTSYRCVIGCTATGVESVTSNTVVVIKSSQWETEILSVPGIGTGSQMFFFVPEMEETVSDEVVSEDNETVEVEADETTEEVVVEEAEIEESEEVEAVDTVEVEAE